MTIADDPESIRKRREFWRMQLLDELRRKLEALAYEPTLDPRGRRRAALSTLITRFEEIEREELVQARRLRE